MVILLISPWPAQARERQTKTLILKNGLVVLLMHDPEVHRSAAALSVGTGDLYDPVEKLGLAHYLEHMLFLGTQKYPKVNSFDQYLGENSGDNNAYTGDVVTNYYFQVSHEAFEGALDRFSQFFTAPLFDKTYAKREVNAVDSEYEKNKLRDHWRLNHVVNQIAEEGHPLKKFSIGNKETLAGDNRPALLDFYKRYYVASGMKLALLSRVSLRKQQEMVEKYFSSILDHRKDLPVIDPDYRKPLKVQYRFLKIKTIRDMRTLTLAFPTIKLHDHLDSKPGEIVAHVLGHEGRGSLLSKLKEEGLALGLSAGADYSHPDISSFDITVQLTRKGEGNHLRVLEVIFAYIRMLKEHGIRQYTFKEVQTMAQTDFDWKDPQEGMWYVSSLAANMQDYELKDVETLPYLYLKYDPQAYGAILDTLTPENMLVILQSRSIETDRKTKFYDTEYTITQVGGTAFEKLRNPPQALGIHYPEPNNFIPTGLTLIQEEPSLAWDNELARVWFLFDNRFKQPKISMKFMIETPHVYDTVENYARSNLYASAVQEGLNEMVYPIRLAGLSYHLQVRKRGIVLSLGGYSEKISKLLSLVAENLTRISIDKQKFRDLKRSMIRRLKNAKMRSAYSRAGYYNRLLGRVKHYSEEEILQALGSMTFEDLEMHAKKLYERVFITGVVHGNWTEKKVRESLRDLLADLKSRPLPQVERFQEKLEILHPGEEIRFSTKVANNNNALYYEIQVGPMDLPTHARTSLVASIVESDFFTQLRTNQQLGYIVSSFNERVEKQLYFKFIIQSSTYGPFELQDRVELWMKQSSRLFVDLTDEEFERHRKGLIVSLEKKGDSIPEVIQELYVYATRDEGDFKYRKRLTDAVRDLKKEEVTAAAQRIFLDPQTPRKIILIRSKDNNQPVPKGVLTTVAQFKKGRHTKLNK